MTPVENRDYFIHRTRRLDLTTFDRTWAWGYSAYPVTDGPAPADGREYVTGFPTKAAARAAALACYEGVTAR